MNVLIDSKEISGSFESGDTLYIWKINGKENIDERETFLISLVKEKKGWPVWFDREGNISSVPVNEGALGELFYAFINPSKKFILATAAVSGSAASNFKRFLNEFSKDAGIKLIPLFEDRIDEKILSWDYYKKISLSMNFPSYDDVAEFNTSYEGKYFGIIDEIGGLKFDISIAAPKSKQVLNTAQLKEIIKHLIPNDSCSRLLVRGSFFDNEATEEYDIKNAQVKYSEEIEINDTFMSEEDARKVLTHAYADRANELSGLPR